MTHTRRHGGQAVQARRRGERWIRCTDCTDHPRSYRVESQPETPGDFWKAFATFAFLIVAVYAVVIIGAAKAIADRFPA